MIKYYISAKTETSNMIEGYVNTTCWLLQEINMTLRYKTDKQQKFYCSYSDTYEVAAFKGQSEYILSSVPVKISFGQFSFYLSSSAVYHLLMATSTHHDTPLCRLTRVTIYSPHQVLLVNQIEKNEMGGACCMHGRDKK